MKTLSSNNADTLVAPDDNRMLNDIYSEDELLISDFELDLMPLAELQQPNLRMKRPPS